MKLKICGMKYNTEQVARLQPDYLGFIFYEGSERNFSGPVPTMPSGIETVGVFVDAPLPFVVTTVTKNRLDIIQLHGSESADYCLQLKKSLGRKINIWKVFSIGESFNFDRLEPYENYVSTFLFDTKGTKRGGNGYAFDWRILNEYTSQKPFILSGGIGLEDVSAIKELYTTTLPMAAIDVNSRFETRPGEKNIAKLRKLKEQLF